MQALEDDEDAIGVLGVDPDPVVGHRELEHVAVAPRRDLHARRLVAAELDRVGDQVLQDEPEQRPLAVDLGQAPAHLDGGAASPRSRARASSGVLHELADVDELALALDAADPREGEQVVDQRLHALGAVDGEVDVLLAALVELPRVAALEHLAEARHLAQRLLEVVRGDVGELLELGVGALERRGLLLDLRLGRADGLEVAHDARAHRSTSRLRATMSLGPLGSIWR